jgi:uroporphyrinogen decarboxylase
MTSHQRFGAALGRRNPDRVPIDYQSKRGIDLKVKATLGLSTERDLLDALGCDFYYLSARDISQNETSVPIYRGPKLEMTAAERVCPFGIRFRRAVGDDKFGADEALAGPLERADTVKDILAHPFPDPKWFDVEALLPECEAYSDKVIVGGFWSGIFGDSYRMHGFQNFLLNMAMNPEMIHALVGRVTDFYLELNDRIFSALRGRMRIFFMGNDFGTQGGLLFSEDMWRDFFSEPYKKLIGHAKGHGLTVMVHSCGAIYPLLPYFADLGVDIIDPVQTTAAGMEPAKLKETFGGRLVFHGAIDTQTVLPRGAPEDVRAHVKETVRVLGRDGGYIFASCNSLQDDTPVENVRVMYETARDASWQGDRL